MIYLTFGESPSGVYRSQIIDVCQYLRGDLGAAVRLVAFISPRDFLQGRKTIKQAFSNAIVLPMIPKVANWRWNRLSMALICLLLRDRALIARGAVATTLALDIKKLGLVDCVCYDGRGAVASEWSEYLGVCDFDVADIERRAVLQSDFRIAVSRKLVEYWSTRFEYADDRHRVVPCTLNTQFQTRISKYSVQAKVRKRLGFRSDDVIVAYAGSGAGWQSMHLMRSFAADVLERSRRIKLLILSKSNLFLHELIGAFPEQVKQRWVDHREVHDVLSACDYGYLIREDSATNRVAAPVKFAEYLAAGLSILISACVGDYSEFVKETACGSVIDPPDFSGLELRRQSWSSKVRRAKLAADCFTKDAHREQYTWLLERLNQCTFG